jgi:hypothetical protein
MSLRFHVLAFLICAVPALSATIPGGDFSDAGALAGLGWSIVNNSSPAGLTTWFQGNPAIFTAHEGADDDYLAANFLAAEYGGDVSLWLITPVLTFVPGDVLTFYTRDAGNPFGNSMEVRLSTNGSSSDVGSSTTSVGDFTTLLGAVNPLRADSGYPASWTALDLPIAAGGHGRVAFRYLVTDTAIHGDYIGLDSVGISTSAVPEPSALLLAGFAGGMMFWRLARRHSGCTK